MADNKLSLKWLVYSLVFFLLNIVFFLDWIYNRPNDISELIVSIIFLVTSIVFLIVDRNKRYNYLKNKIDRILEQLNK